MNDPDDLREWAAAYRRAGQPSADLRARIVSATGVRVSLPQRSRWRDAATHVGIAAVLAIAALLVLSWISRAMVAMQQRAADNNMAPYRHEAAPAVEPATAGHAPVPAELVPATTPTIATPGAPTDTAPKRTPSLSSSAAHSNAKPDSAADVGVDDGGDLESLRRLRAAESLLVSDPARALALLDAHAVAYPDSAMALEREVLWIRAACRTGAAPTLGQRRAALAKRPGVAAYRAAIEKDCAAR